MIREQQVTLTIRYDDSSTGGKEPVDVLRFAERLNDPDVMAVVGIGSADPTDVYDVEVTDTFGGEANYSWVRRYTVSCNEGTHCQNLIRAAKKAAGWNGMACRTEKWGDGTIALFQRGAAVVMFITPRTDGPLGD